MGLSLNQPRYLLFEAVKRLTLPGLLVLASESLLFLKSPESLFLTGSWLGVVLFIITTQYVLTRKLSK